MEMRIIMQERHVRNRLKTDFQHIDALVAANSAHVASAVGGCTPNMNPADNEAVLDKVVAQVMGTESAIARMRFLSGVKFSETIESALLHVCVCVDRKSKDRVGVQVHMLLQLDFVHAYGQEIC